VHLGPLPRASGLLIPSCSRPYPSSTVAWSGHPLPLPQARRACVPRLSAPQLAHGLTPLCLVPCRQRQKPHGHVGPHCFLPLMFPPSSLLRIVAPAPNCTLPLLPLPSLAPPSRRHPGSPLSSAQQQQCRCRFLKVQMVQSNREPRPSLFRSPVQS
jgi:hypothetical protein